MLSLIVLKNLIALGFLGFFGLTLWMRSISSADPNPAAGQLIREHVRYGGHYYLSPTQDAWNTWWHLAIAALTIAMMFAHRIIKSYDPVAANLPPRSPDIDPFAAADK
jgi:hypothetical protein